MFIVHTGIEEFCVLTQRSHPTCKTISFVRFCVHAVVFSGVGEGRGVYNDSSEELEMFKVGVTLLRNEDQDPTDPKLDTITEFGDDLSSR